MTSQRVLRRFAKDWVTRVVRCPLRDPMVEGARQGRGVREHATANDEVPWRVQLENERFALCQRSELGTGWSPSWIVISLMRCKPS